MAEISTNIILDGITLALREAYPDSHIESGTIKQGLEPPAFIVRLVSAEQMPYAGRRQRRSPRFDVRYFPREGNEECYQIADELCTLLELIQLPSGDLVRGTDLGFEVVDGVLHFLVTYNHNVIVERNESAMGELELTQGGM